ncbi:DUF1992 domain-containing protein [Spiractinospora alimapuensis]|uniref:DnaJ family domain-containing protein n=1 Tax=Spiractinospora alimapuensis TaxID=2820884 RepID=UPI001F2A63D6|nr:DUF1992 domain-containing protein [Spiractinospora alimapuensis]QVQ52147.1 DUF1992 domain-containing protein [Spiractinospora alimapuensis]
MVERKPTGEPFESWVEKQIREAVERGEFDDVPGTGLPIQDIDRPRDDLWWVKKKMRAEGLSYLPPTLALRKAAEQALADAADASSEAEVRQILTEINRRIREMNMRPPEGPPLNLVPVDVERFVRRWRIRRHKSASNGD